MTRDVLCTYTLRQQTAGSSLTHPPPRTVTFLWAAGTPKIYRSFFTFRPSPSPGLALGHFTVDSDHRPLRCITLQRLGISAHEALVWPGSGWVVSVLDCRHLPCSRLRAGRWAYTSNTPVHGPVRRQALLCAGPLPPATPSSVLSHGVTTVPEPGPPCLS